MKRNAIAFFFLAFYNIYGQSEIDSLLTVAERSENDSVQFSAYIQLVDLNIYDAPATSYKYAIEAYKKARQSGAQKSLSIALNRIGSCYWSLGVLDSSLFYFNKSLELARVLNERSLTARNNGNIANIYAASGNYFDAINYSKQALAEFKELKNQNRIFAMYNNIGKYYLDNGEIDSAAHYLSLAGEALKPEFEFMLPIYLFNVADLKFNEGDYQTFDSLLNSCEREAKKYQDNRALIRVEQMRAELLLHQNKNSQALTLAQSAYEKALKTRVKDLIQISASTLSSALRANDRFEESLAKLHLSLAYKDSLENRRIKNQLSIDKFNRNQLEINSLANRNSLLETESSYWKRIIIILSISIITIIILSYTIYRRRQQINQQHKELKELNNFKNKLLAIIIHDLRSPIGQLISTVQLMKSGVNDPKLLDMVKTKVEGLDDLMNNLFGLAYEYMNEDTLKAESFELKLLVNEVADSLATISEAKKITISNKVSGQIYTYADRGLIAIVLRNLIVNAIKFSDKDTKVVINASVLEDRVEVTVKDHGIGMSENQINDLFTTETTHSAGTDGEIGSGLGLILCKDFVERNGGTIKASSAPKKGSTFTFTLPKGE
ncbi:ATP-binding protein [Ekhidna sp.]|uniref:tetratricopeptide repeat-containing sensor histidine kinase n=1 Tax=Ekhidna sp. TaxID=2608089 RepID=UPI0035126424